MPQVSFDALVSALLEGTHLASFPTDTVPALAARPDRADLIFQAKQRSAEKPLILMAGAIADLWQYVTGSEAELKIWQQMAETYLPGALTLVLPASDRVPVTMHPSDPTTIGVRVPNGAIAQAILAQTGALATTSANRSGQPALLTMSGIQAQFPNVLTLSSDEFPDLDAAVSGTPSTVVKWSNPNWHILRQGAVQITLP
ncbi:L-threonylcarbamoyladenylate synthase [Myxacorys almedinensis]|uniref:L-threonylcarbamoyladenylate synthase n=1 Tax=Myxacorys almedinensis A TaxID=2690445 RepID=A0A8J7Z1Z0_9CYAN|nr:L-threonylcarbamoyladenylate synthase [Myxacorys almedinensis]NDJ18882.1 Sua5/YciO/YrdC/YwlC family protein [Myxacorys almedinensis A]